VAVGLDIGELIAVEHHKVRVMPSTVGCLAIIQTRHYGTTAVTFYQAVCEPLTGGGDRS
jgi:16S rRNA G966 N2-methylase RsmD